MKSVSFLFIICLSILLFSCRKTPLTTSSSAKLSFSADTLSFDTVFTTVGSSTEFLKIYNPNSKAIKISNIRLAGGNSSHFRLNIDGIATNTAQNIEIMAKDSLYIFVAVTVDPNNLNNPFVITDSVLFETNGNDQKVILEAWGQNAHFYKSALISGTNLTWTNDKPYVIVNNLYVDKNATLTIMPGCKVYNHPGLILYVLGTLKIMGQPGDSVTFQGDRLEQYFQGLPGDWDGIYLLPSSHDNEIHNAIIRDGSEGILVDSSSVDAQPKLKIYQTVIKNMLYYGIAGITSKIYGENCLIFNIGQSSCIQLELGGNYDFEDCTFADYSNVVINHQKPAVYVSNYFTSDNVNYLFAGLTATFTNCIMYGSLDKELKQDPYPNNTPFSTTFSNCCIKTTDAVTGSAIINSDPAFKDYTNDNYHLTAGSPCIGKGTNTNGITVDLDNYTRGNNIDIGAYQYH